MADKCCKTCTFYEPSTAVVGTGDCAIRGESSLDTEGEFCELYLPLLSEDATCVVEVSGADLALLLRLLRQRLEQGNLNGKLLEAYDRPGHKFNVVECDEHSCESCRFKSFPENTACCTLCRQYESGSTSPLCFYRNVSDWYKGMKKRYDKT